MTKAVESSISLPGRLSRLAPGLGLRRTYERNWLRPDVVDDFERQQIVGG